MTDGEMAEIRERVEKATEGHWMEVDGGYIVCFTDINQEDPEIIAESENDVDAAFIANAREDIPKLLEEIERLRDGISLLDGDISACMAYKLPMELSEISGYLNDILYGGDGE